MLVIGGAKAQEIENNPLIEETWVRLGGPQGGLGYDIRMDPRNNDVMYVTDAWAGVHKSTDGGATWYPINDGIDARVGLTGESVPAFSLTIDPHNPDILWAGMTGLRGIYKSTDGGETWELKITGIRESGITFRGFTVDPQNSDIVYAAGEVSSWEWAGVGLEGAIFDRTQGRVYRTINGGDSWTLIWRGDNLARYVWVHPSSSDLIFVSTGIFDREAANTDPSTETAGGVGILRSEDGGQTWEEIDEDHGLAGLYVGSLAMHSENPDLLLAGVGHDHWSPAGRSISGVFFSEDGGDSWEMALRETNGVLMSIEYCLSDPNVAYAGGTYNFYRSEDAGRTWVRVGGASVWGPPGMIAAFPIDIQCGLQDPNRLFVNNYQGGNFLSTDGGRSWQEASKGYSGAEIDGDIYVDPENPGSLYVAARSGMFVSRDGGYSWEGLSYAPARYNQINALGVHPDDFDTLIISPWDLHRLARSSTGGLSWSLLEGTSPNLFDTGYTARDIEFSAANPEFIFIATGEGKECFYSLYCDSNQGHLYRSTNGGTSWRVVDSRNVAMIATHPTDELVIYLGTMTSGVLGSTDGGETWSSMNSGLTNHRIRSLVINPENSDVLLAGTAFGGIYKSEDAGASWRQVSAGLPLEAIITDIVFDPAHSGYVWAADIHSGVYYSPDGGTSWYQKNDGLDVRAVAQLAISADGEVLYAGTLGAGVFRLATRSQADFDQIYLEDRPTTTANDTASDTPLPTEISTPIPSPTATEEELDSADGNSSLSPAVWIVALVLIAIIFYLTRQRSPRKN